MAGVAVKLAHLSVDLLDRAWWRP